MTGAAAFGIRAKEGHTDTREKFGHDYAHENDSELVLTFVLPPARYFRDILDGAE